MALVSPHCRTVGVASRKGIPRSVPFFTLILIASRETISTSGMTLWLVVRLLQQEESDERSKCRRIDRVSDAWSFSPVIRVEDRPRPDNEESRDNREHDCDAKPKTAVRHSADDGARSGHRLSFTERGLVLVCFEPVGAFCHRRVLASWLEDQTGERVPELEGSAGTSVRAAVASTFAGGGDHEAAAGFPRCLSVGRLVWARLPRVVGSRPWLVLIGIAQATRRSHREA
jgi:hypothetical protein